MAKIVRLQVARNNLRRSRACRGGFRSGFCKYLSIQLVVFQSLRIRLETFRGRVWSVFLLSPLDGGVRRRYIVVRSVAQNKVPILRCAVCRLFLLRGKYRRGNSLLVGVGSAVCGFGVFC